VKNILYIDKEFLTGYGGDKNRSRYLFNALKTNNHVYTCIIEERANMTLSKPDIMLTPEKEKIFLLPDAIKEFSETMIEYFISCIKSHHITDIFIRTIAYAKLAEYAKKRFLP